MITSNQGGALSSHYSILKKRNQLGLGEKKEFFNTFSTWKKMDLMSTIFGLLGLLIGIITWEYDNLNNMVFVSQKTYEFD